MKRKGKGVVVILVLLALVITLNASALYEGYLKLQYPRNYASVVEEEAARFDLDPALVYAVIKAESKFDEGAQSKAGAKGLMQLTPETFSWMIEKYAPPSEEPDIWKPEDNIYAGCALLKLLLSNYESRELALCAYNAGMGNVSRWMAEYSTDGKSLDQIPFPETRAYVEKVERYYGMYQRLYGEREG